MNRAALVVFLGLVGAAFGGCSVARAEKPSTEVLVLVSTRDLAAGETVTLADVAQRRLPAEWATSSSVKPDSANYIINQRVTLPVMKGDVLYWSFFETTRTDEAQERCRKLTHSGNTAAEQVARARQVVLRRARE